MADYCNKCGNSRTTLEGTPCECVSKYDFMEYEFKGSIAQFIPQQYKNLKFTKSLVKATMPDSYKEYLQRLFSEIVTGKLKYQNILLISPPSTSKTIWVYDVLDSLAKRGVKIMPLFDLYEIKRFLLETKETLEEYSVSDIYTVEYLFIRIPLDINPFIFNSIGTIIDRRVRKGNTTIFLYSGIYPSLSAIDKISLLSNMKGDGSFKTLRVEQFFEKK